jgi:ATP-dependent RNA helicase RhlE
MSFENLGLKAELLRAVSAQGYTRATPIQEKAVPIILQGRDVLAGAQTGTGKTAAFTLPLLQLLSSKERSGPQPRALVLTPTRELAAQVGASVTTYGKHLSLRSTTIFGGVGINPQKDRLRRGVDILVATPGRLLDHAGQGTVDLSRIEILVLDEADRMLDMGFIHDIKRVLKLLPKRRQNLLFSATYSNEIKKLADGLLYKPELIEVARRNTAAQTVDQSVHLVDRANKRKLLSHLIHEGGWDQVLVFTRTKHGANRLSDQLGRDGITSAAIHGNKSQTARTRALQQFKSSEIRVLVATDIAARGLDIERLPHVVNFELPQVPEDYVHRIGRTGRAGSNGVALSLVSAEERKQLKDIQKLLKKQIPTASVPGFEATEEAPPANEARRDPPPRRRQNRRRNSGGRARASN